MSLSLNKFKIVLGFLVLIVSQLKGQDYDPHYIQYSVLEGLPSSEVYDLEVDSLNQLWISTDRGVCLYNGYDFKTFTTEDGLADNCNFEIFRDSKNRMWFNGYNQTLSIYRIGEFKPYQFNSLIGNNSKANQGRWVVDVYENDNKELFYSMVSSRSIALFKFNEESIPVGLDIDLSSDSLDILIKTKQNILEYDNVPFSFYRVNWLNFVFALSHKDRDYYYNKNELFERDSNTGEIKSQILDHKVEKLFVDSDNNLWVCTLKGLYCYPQADLSVSPKYYFSELSISSIVEDLEGNYWMSTNDAGIFFIPSFEFTNVINKSDDEKVFNYQSISVLENHILFSTTNAGLFSIDKSHDKRYISLEKQTQSQLVSRQVELITVNDTAYIGSNTKVVESGNGLQITTVPKATKKTEFHIPGAKKFMLSNQTKIIDALSGFYVYNHDGVLTFESKTSKFPFTERVTCILEVGDDIWIGSISGLFKVENYEYERIEEILRFGKSFERISDIKIDHYNNLWIGTIGGGVYYINDQEIAQLTMENGLSSNMINQILVSPDSLIWLATNNGINAISYTLRNGMIDKQDIKNLNNFDGLISNYVNDIDFWNGKLWAATNEGVCSFDPVIIQKKYSEVPIVFDQFVVNDSSYLETSTREFENNQNDVLIHYTGVRYRKNKNTSIYRYRLVTNHSDSKESWFTTSENNIRYNNLSPGTYRFEIAARNKIGEWNKQPKVLEFVINPHFTETVWFRLMALLCSVLLFGGILYYQIQRYRAKVQKDKELKEAKLKSQAFELATLRNQMNPHFVFNSLNSIQNFIYKKDVSKANYFLSKFSKLMRDSLQYTRLDFIPLASEIDFLNNYLELESMRFPEKFEFSITVSEELDIDGLLVPPFLLQPILENSIKHAFNDIDYRGKIKVNISEAGEEMLLIELSDNGKGRQSNNNGDSGIQMSEEHKSLGLTIVSDRIKLMNKTYYDGKAKLKFENLFLGEIGFRVNIIVPISYSND